MSNDNPHHHHHSSAICLLLLLILLYSTIALKLSLNVQPRGVGPGSEHYVVNAGQRLELSCELDINGQPGDAEHLDGIDWMHGQLRVEPTWMSMFTQPQLEEKGRLARQLLVIPEADAKLAGEYRCVYFDDVERRVKVHVLAKIDWRLKSDTPGGPLGQSLTIDCGANGVDNSAIKIMDQAGHAIEESQLVNKAGGAVYVAGSELTIPKLTIAHQDMKIRCVAIRTVPLDAEWGSSTIHYDERELTINVWLPPQFADLANGGHFYAAPGSTVVLRWTVLTSNPPVLNFTLKRDGEPIDQHKNNSNGKYAIQVQQGKTVALSINEVADEDYGRYTCIAYNGKLAGQQSAILDIPKPPKQPRVWAEQVTNGSVSWHIEEQQEQGQLPVSYFWITYQPLRRRIQHQKNTTTAWPLAEEEEDDLSQSSEESGEWQQRDRPINGNGGGGRKGELLKGPNNDGWEVLTQNTSNTIGMRRRKNPANVYDIAGLDPYTEYLFTIVAGNTAGESDALTRKQETVDHAQWSAAQAQRQAGREGNGHAAEFNAAKYIGTSIGVIFSCILVALLCGCACACCPSGACKEVQPQQKSNTKVSSNDPHPPQMDTAAKPIVAVAADAHAVPSPTACPV